MGKRGKNYRAWTLSIECGSRREHTNMATDWRAELALLDDRSLGSLGLLASFMFFLKALGWFFRLRLSRRVKCTWAPSTAEPHYERNLEIKRVLTLCSPLPTPADSRTPERIVWPVKTHQWGNLLIFFLPVFPLPELFVSFCSLPLFYLQGWEGWGGDDQ